MKKCWLALSAALLLPALAAAELMPNREGTFYWPEGSDESTAGCVYTYSYPCLTGDTEGEVTVNNFYDYLISDTGEFTVSMIGEMREDPTLQTRVEVNAELECEKEEVLSFLVTTKTTVGEETTLLYSGHTFTMTGNRAGNATTLPRLMGILSDSETDTWLEERQVNKANELVCGMVWERLQEKAEAGEITLLPEADEELLACLFYPEEDFYLDGDGEPVFILQPGDLTEERDGVVLISITFEEIDDEL